MNKLCASALLLLTGLFAAINGSAQQDSVLLNKIETKLNTFTTAFPPEKVYIHFDKPYYAVADTIWFKAYVVQGQNQPTQLSKIVYVDIITASDSLVATLKLPVNAGAAYGNIPLDKDTYRQGNYYIRAYTLWMMNYDAGYFFNKNISIGEAIDKQLITHIRYVTNPDQKVNAIITFKNTDGKPYAQKQVNWQILTNLDEVNKGRGNTDATGTLVVPMQTDKKTAVGANSKLVTALNAVDKEDPIASSINLVLPKGPNDLQFFPEGGELISGLPLQIAFKGIKSSGLGIASKGIVKDGAGNKVADFSSQHLGMGAFYLTTEPGKTYKAEVTFSDGTSGTFQLPEVKDSGIALQVNSRTSASVDIKILTNNAFLEQNKGKTFFIIGQHNGVTYFSAKANLQKQIITLKIPKQSLPAGMLQVSLISPALEPLSERLIFVKYKSPLNLDIKADKPAYGIKQKVTLTISAKDSLKAVAGTSLSVSVIDETKVPYNEDKETTIISSLLLTSDLQGYIEQPNYYFNQPDEKKIAELDLLMLTQGFRRFILKDLLADKFPERAFLPEQGITISGTLRNKTGLPINKGTMLLTIPDKRYNKQMVTSPVGVFRFTDLVFNDSSKVTLSAKYNPNPNNLMMILDGMPEPAVSFNKNKADEIINIDSSMTAYLANSSKQYRFMRTIKEVLIAGAKAKKPSHADHPALSTLSMLADHVISGETVGDCSFLVDCMKYKLTGVTFDREEFYVTRSYNAGDRTPMLIFLNGMQIDFNGINSVPTSDVESIEIFLKDQIGTLSRANNTNGVIVINTKKPVPGAKKKYTAEDLKKLIPDSHTITYTPKGYSKEREFYQPKYSADPAALNFTDLRTTVYWNPQLTTDANGITTVSFFNADGKGNYKAVLEGQDSNGNIARKVFRYVVK